jgi:MOSC domain-containing protein YiiM
MDSVSRARLRAGQGIVGNADQQGRRQVTLIECRAWDAAVEQVGVAVEPSARRANLLISGLSLTGSRGRTLRVGRCELRIHGETRPCERMDEAQPGLQAALGVPWRGGAFAEVLSDAEIEVGATVEWSDGSGEERMNPLLRGATPPGAEAEIGKQNAVN